MTDPRTTRPKGVARFRPGIFTAIALFALSGCSDPLATDRDVQEARDHLAAILDLMETNSINRREIEWAQFRSTVNSKAPDPKTIGDLFDAIYVALGLLGDNHSSYISPAAWGLTIRNSQIVCSADPVVMFSPPQDVGYVRVASFSGTSGSGPATTYANSIQTSIRLADARSPVGWVVDLRGNAGGNMWPMIAGLGPLLGETVLGYFIPPDGLESTWDYLGGVARSNGTTVQAVAAPYTVQNPGQRVAVLIDGNVSSSGEAVAIAFTGRPNTRFFGSPTCGLSTANTTFGADGELHGALLILTVANMADRTRTTYGGSLTPDEVFTDQSALKERALQWLRGG